jgi:DNA-binding NtrC family response regulator
MSQSRNREQRVLVADDDAAFRSLMVAKLRRAGYDVTELHDGGELLDALQSVRPGYFRVVVTDQRMPGLFGLECLARAGSRAPFVIVSGSDDASFQDSARRFGAAAVLSKTTDLDRVVEVVSELAAEGAARSKASEPPHAI